jgi:hypothetical protein
MQEDVKLKRLGESPRVVSEKRWDTIDRKEVQDRLPPVIVSILGIM